MHRFDLAGEQGPSLAALVTLTALILAFSALPQPVAASPGWDLILDRPSPNLGGIDFVSPSEGWLVAGAGLLHTTDGGATWQEQAEITVSDVAFADADHGWAVGLSGAIYATKNGTSWQPQDSGTDVHLADVVAISAQEAWAVGSGSGFSDVVIFPIPSTLLHTIDGGASWQQVELPDQTWFDQIEFAGTNGWLLGDGCVPSGGPDQQFCSGKTRTVILRTVDGGVTWTPIEGDLPGAVDDIDFVDALNGWITAEDCAGGCHRTPYRTADGGESWELAGLSADVQADQVEAPDARNVWVAGPTFDGVIEVHHSGDGGATWVATGSVLINLFEYLRHFSIDEGRFLITGGALATRSSDGASWSAMVTPVFAPAKLDFVSANTGFAISGNHVIRSDDGGETWRTVAPAPGLARVIEFLDASTGFAWTTDCGQGCGPTIQRTTDGGRTWQPVFTTNEASGLATRLQFADSQHGWLVTERAVFATDDGGSSWQQRSSPVGTNGFIQEADLTSATHGWLVAFENPTGSYELFRTEDAARSWEPVPIDAGVYPRAIDFVGSQHGWVSAFCQAGCDDPLYATSNGGQSWTKLRDTSRLLYSDAFIFVDRLNGWANTFDCTAACFSQISHTADGGRTWATQLEGDVLQGSFAFLDARHGWFLTDPNRGIGLGGGPPQRTLLYRTTDGGGGPIGEETPPPKLPDTGAREAVDSTGILPLVALLALASGALWTAGLLLRRRR